MHPASPEAQRGSDVLLLLGNFDIGVEVVDSETTAESFWIF